jgi:hypothetical protein
MYEIDIFSHRERSPHILVLATVEWDTKGVASGFGVRERPPGKNLEIYRENPVHRKKPIPSFQILATPLDTYGVCGLLPVQCT